MIDTIDFTKVEDLAKSHKDNLDTLPFKSLTAAISFDELREFIKQAEAKTSPAADAAIIYFVRYKFDPTATEDRIEKAKKGDELSQVSLVFVPAKIKDKSLWKVDELKDKSDDTKILTLCFCNPNDPRKDETGMCPPKCKT